MAAPQVAKTLTGIVTKINGHGFKIDSSDGWQNFSKFGAAPDMPELGQVVTIGLDDRGFVRTVEPGTVQTMPAAATGATERAASLPAALSTRMACLSAAATFLAGRADANPFDVLAAAEEFEAWARMEGSR
jgi:hypothetical protein